MLRLSVGGDAEGGWMVDIHDGEKNGCYRPEGDTPVAALVAAIKAHDPALLEAMKAGIGGDEDKREVARLTAELTDARNDADLARKDHDEAVAQLAEEKAANAKPPMVSEKRDAEHV